MNRSGNIGAAKNMDSVFADFTDDDLEQDLIFDEDDQLVEIVEGYTEEGNTIFEEDEEIFKIAHQIMDDDQTPEEVKKDTEDLLGPDSKGDQNIKDIENVKKEELDDSQTIENLKRNGESEADKELGLEKLDDEYNSTADASVKEAARVEAEFEKWINEEAYDNKAEDEAEGSDTKFGNKELDNSAMPADDIKPTDDENYNATNDASVKEEYDYDKPDEAEGTDDKFGKAVDNTEMKPEEIAPKGDENYNATNDATVKEEPFKESTEQQDCTCGKDDCPICRSKKAELAPDNAPVEDKTSDGERHEESNGDSITDADGEGIAPGQVDDNTLPKENEMTPEGSPESDNGDISDDTSAPEEKKECPEGACEKSEVEKVEEAFEAWLKESDDFELPVMEPNETITPAEVEKAEEELEKSAPESDAEIKTEATDEAKPEGTTSTMPEADATVPEDEACGKGSGCSGKGSCAVKEEDNSLADLGNEANVKAMADSIDKEVGTDNSSLSTDDTAGDPPINEAAEDEEEIPTATDVEDAAKTEVEDTESELDDDLAAVIDDSDEVDEDLEYDPSDEDLIDLAGGEAVDESVLMEGKDPERVDIAKKMAKAITDTLIANTDLKDRDFKIVYKSFNMLGTGKGKDNKEFLKGESNEIYFGIAPGFKGSDLLVNGGPNRQAKAFEIAKQTIKNSAKSYESAIKKATGKSVSITTVSQTSLDIETVIIKVTLK